LLGVANAFAQCTPADPCDINSASQLESIGVSPSDPLSGDYVLASNINASSVVFAPIGSSSTPFTGSLNGNGFTISDLTINLPSADGVGLFADTSASAVINDVDLTNVNITGYNDTAALVGINNGTITSSTASGTVTGSLIESSGPTSSNTGGLVGFNLGTISGSSASAIVAGGQGVGGLAGNNSGTIFQSSASGSVSGAQDGVGGLLGGNNGTVSQSHASGNVTGYVYNNGGLAGSNGGSITDSYATGNVNGGINNGGLVGQNNASVSTSYSTGLITGGNSGGLIGNSQSAATYSNSYWDTDTSGTLNASGAGSIVGISPLTNAVLTNSALPSGFEPTVWTATTGQYPTLNWQNPPPTLASLSSALNGSVQTYFPHGPDGDNWASFVSSTQINRLYPPGYLALLPASQASFSTGIGATFIPNGISLLAAAALVPDPTTSDGTPLFPSGFNHFNWLQTIYIGTTEPSSYTQYTQFDPSDTGCTDSVEYIKSSYTYVCQGSTLAGYTPSPVPVRNSDLLPWYLDERFTVDGQQVYADDTSPPVGPLPSSQTPQTREQQWTINPDTLLFNDNPSGGELTDYFVTCLAAVDAAGEGETIFAITGNNDLGTCFQWQATPIVPDLDTLPITDGIGGIGEDDIISDGPISAAGLTPSDFEALAGGGDYLIVPAASVPEPASIFLFGSGFLCLLGSTLLMRRRWT
jgi:hypothetical protein